MTDETDKPLMDAPREVTARELSPEMLSQAAELLGVTPEDLLNDPGCEADAEKQEEDE